MEKLEMIPKCNFEALKRINIQFENKITKLERENRELKKKLEILKKFSILGEIINEKKSIFNL